MVREFDKKVRLHFKQADDVFECKYCGREFKGKPSVTKLRHHLLGEKNKGVRTCEKVSEHIKVDILAIDSNKRRRILESTSVNNEIVNLASTSLSLQNNQLVQEQASLQTEVYATEQDRSCQVILKSSNLEIMPKQLKTHQVRATPLLTSELEGEKYKKKLEEIWSSLMKENVSKVGIYGMGGVGKTELARHIYNRLLEHPNYDFICWITVSPDFSIHKLQNIIANSINFELPNKDVEIIRAELSRKMLEKKFVIILDDLWSYISLDDAGMTYGRFDGCKLIMTTRSLHICQTMNCQEIVLVDCHQYSWCDEGGWNIFVKELGKQGSLSEEIDMVAKEIVKECGDLPLMIKSMARSMRGAKDIHEWRNALEEMK